MLVSVSAKGPEVTTRPARSSKTCENDGVIRHAKGQRPIDLRDVDVDGLRVGQAAGVPISRAADFYVLEAVFIDDPDGNGIELSWDRPRHEWPEDWATTTGLGTPRPLNVEELLTTAAVTH